MYECLKLCKTYLDTFSFNIFCTECSITWIPDQTLIPSYPWLEYQCYTRYTVYPVIRVQLYIVSILWVFEKTSWPQRMMSKWKLYGHVVSTLHVELVLVVINEITAPEMFSVRDYIFDVTVKRWQKSFIWKDDILDVNYKTLRSITNKKIFSI